MTIAEKPGRIIDFPTICTICGYFIKNEDIFLSDTEMGFVCERCPEFSRGGVTGIDGGEMKNPVEELRERFLEKKNKQTPTQELKHSLKNRNGLKK